VRRCVCLESMEKAAFTNAKRVTMEAVVIQSLASVNVGWDIKDLIAASRVIVCTACRVTKLMVNAYACRVS